MPKLALIGGTGLNQLQGLEPVTEHSIETPFGAPSAAIVEGRFGDTELLFLARHGVPHSIPPHRINYRANLWALRELGVTEILAVFAVGGILGEMTPGHFVIPDQVIDYTWGREHTFFDGKAAPLEHIDFTEPFSAALRLRLVECAQNLPLDCSPSGTYGATQGPRLETAAEIRRMSRDGCDVVGMTGMPEAALAAELRLPYAAICMVVNPAAGLGETPITEAAMHEILVQETAVIGELLRAFIDASPQ